MTLLQFIEEILQVSTLLGIAGLIFGGLMGSWHRSVTRRDDDD